MSRFPPHIDSFFSFGSKLSDSQENSISFKSEVRVVSFDLDNTLWKTGKTIDAANDALAAFMNEHRIEQPQRVEKIMGDLFRENKALYCPVEKDEGKSPVLLTMLRKDATQKILREHNNYSRKDAAAFADVAFEVWSAARHKAIPDNLASSVQSCLKQIESIKTSLGHPIVIGAITDGNSDPRLIEEFSGIFDFVINAESVGISKPDKRVYMRAVSQVMLHPAMKDLAPPGFGDVDNDDFDLTEFVGPWWIHCGDDFVKDIVAAKSLNMRTVWARELVTDKVAEANTNSKETAKTRSVEDLVKQVSSMKTIEMQVGADDYLADSLQNEFADGIVDRFEDLGNLLQGWHEEALATKTANDALEPLQTEDSEAVAKSEMPPSASGRDAATRLQDLENIKHLLSEQEYQDKRAEILSSL